MDDAMKRPRKAKCQLYSSPINCFIHRNLDDRKVYNTHSKTDEY